MIKPMNLSHVSQIAELEKLCFSDPWSENSIASELENPLSFWLVFEENGAVLGYVGSQSVAPESDMMNLAVEPHARKRGIAQALVGALCDELISQKMESLTLEVRASNEPAIKLYTKLGFEIIGRRPRYYVNPQEDALIMRKELCNADTVC